MAKGGLFLKKIVSIIMSICVLMLFTFSQAYAKEKTKAPEPAKDKITIPKSVVDISKSNTYPNPTTDEPELKPSELSKELLNTADVKIENPTLIHMLNESNIHTTKLSIGYHAKIYLGKWPLNYQSEKTSVNWEFKQVNDNAIDNRGNNKTQTLSYQQERQYKVEGGLTGKVPNEHEVKKLMMIKAAEKTELPISFSTYIGHGTKVNRIYHVEPKKVGHLYGYVPAVNEKGKVTYGEVYLVLKGGKKYIEVKNVTQQGIGAWIPIQDYLSLKYIPTN